MVHLIFAVVTLALISGITAATMNYVPVSAYQSSAMLTQVQGAFTSYQHGVGRYLTSERTALPGDPAPGYYIPYPGNGVDVRPNVVPKYLFEPKPLNDYSWEVVTATMGADIPAIAICMKPDSGSTVTPMKLEAFKRVQQQFPVGSVFLSDACQAQANSETPGTHITLWVPLSHYE